MTTTLSRCGLDGRQCTSCTKNTMQRSRYLHHNHWLDLPGPDPELGQHISSATNCTCGSQGVFSVLRVCSEVGSHVPNAQRRLH
jgi:hypothetical protein